MHWSSERIPSPPVLILILLGLSCLPLVSALVPHTQPGDTSSSSASRTYEKNAPSEPSFFSAIRTGGASSTPAIRRGVPPLCDEPSAARVSFAFTSPYQQRCSGKVGTANGLLTYHSGPVMHNATNYVIF